MSSTILPPGKGGRRTAAAASSRRKPGANPPGAAADWRDPRSPEGNRAGGPADQAANGAKDPCLAALGQRVRTLRARRGLTRDALAQASGVSKRHLANLEYGIGNASILVLHQIAAALQCPMAELMGDVTTRSPEWLLLRDMLAERDEATLHRVRLAVAELLGTGRARQDGARPKDCRIALIGLRGAGKTTLGSMLAEDLGYPFIEISRDIETLAGCSIGEVQALYGQNAYRRYERRAIEEAIGIYPEAVIATAGGMVSDLASFNLMLAQCTTVWLRAEPEDHMKRVVAQGDMRPMAASVEAMEDLRTILAGREALYAKADLRIDTSAQPLAETFLRLRAAVRNTLGLPG
ncbi:MAG TPA: helix-turn-helix transcriptional regulator [Acetobacteraceae bacterium]|nr:helix-turn-helix transcriptional regulator [Acetobacteraceae bacterium]